MKYGLTVKDALLSERALSGESLGYLKRTTYEELSPKDVPVKAYWLNWSTTT